MPLAPGTRFGPYEIAAKLGAGGMGEVYRARDTRLGRVVALKVLLPDAGEDAARRRRLLQEARAASALNHPNIVTVHDVGSDEHGADFVAMELVEGVSLAQRLARGQLPRREALGCAIDIARGLAAAHAAGIVHRDLKPGNVMRAADGAAKILDFGIARSVAPASGDTATIAPTAEGVVVGTAGYMSPEQAEGRSVDARSDIFSFGVLLYEMISGQRPFARDTSVATLAAIVRDEPRPLSQSAPGVPRELEQLVMKCLRKDPTRRAQSMADVRVALEDVRDEIASGRSETTTPAISRSRRPAWTVVGLLIAAAVGGVVVSLMPARRGNERPAASLPTDLARLTYDDGFTERAAISPDGTLVAYATDRAGGDNLDIWLQRAAGGDPIQLTREAADEHQPSFSPDGGTVVYRSENAGGALFTVPALGGEPRLLVADGIDAVYSPDGRSIAYWTGSQIGFDARPGAYRTFIVDAAGGTPAELRGFTGVRFPVWSPDGQFLLVVASRAETPAASTYDWWIVRPDGRDAYPTNAAALLRASSVETAALLALPAPTAWHGDRLLTAAGGSLLAVTLSKDPQRAASQVQRLTFGPGDASGPSVSRDGAVAFVGSTSSHNIWALPVNVEEAKVRGELRQITNTAGTYGRGTFAEDGRLAFQAQRGSIWSVMVRDPTNGRITDVGVKARAGGPVISPDGTRVAYLDVDGAAYVIPTRGGPRRKLCDDCSFTDWSSDGRRIATVLGVGRERRAKLLDVDAGDGATILEGNIDRIHLTPDNRWMAFRTEGDARRSIYVARVTPGSPPRRSDWVTVVDGEVDARPCGWSPSGRMLYLVSSRDGFRCLYACPWDPEKGQPRGGVQLVRHIHNIRNFGGGGASIISTGMGNAVMKDQVLLDLASTASSIWTMRLPRVQ